MRFSAQSNCRCALLDNHGPHALYGHVVKQGPQRHHVTVAVNVFRINVYTVFSKSSFDFAADIYPLRPC